MMINPETYLQCFRPCDQSDIENSLHFTDILGMKCSQDVGHGDFLPIGTLLPPGASVFYKHLFNISIVCLD